MGSPKSYFHKFATLSLEWRSKGKSRNHLFLAITVLLHKFLLFLLFLREMFSRSAESFAKGARQRRIANSAQASASSHRQVEIDRERRRHVAEHPRDARFGPEPGPSFTVYHEEDRPRIWESRFDEQRNSVIPPLMHGQVTDGHWQSDGWSPHHSQMFPSRPLARRIPPGFEWDEPAQEWLVPRPMTEPQGVFRPVREEEVREPLNPFAAMFGAGSRSAEAPAVHEGDQWIAAVTSYYQAPEGVIGRFRTDGTTLVDWKRPRDIAIGSYVVVPPLSLGDLQLTLAADVRAACDEQTLLSISNPYFLKVGALTHDVTGRWFRLDQVKDHVCRPQEPPIFTSKSVRLDADSTVPMLVLTAIGTSFVPVATR